MYDTVEVPADDPEPESELSTVTGTPSAGATSVVCSRYRPATASTVAFVAFVPFVAFVAFVVSTAVTLMVPGSRGKATKLEMMQIWDEP